MIYIFYNQIYFAFLLVFRHSDGWWYG